MYVIALSSCKPENEKVWRSSNFKRMESVKTIKQKQKTNDTTNRIINSNIARRTTTKNEHNNYAVGNNNKNANSSNAV